MGNTQIYRSSLFTRSNCNHFCPHTHRFSTPAKSISRADRHCRWFRNSAPSASERFLDASRSYDFCFPRFFKIVCASWQLTSIFQTSDTSSYRAWNLFFVDVFMCEVAQWQSFWFCKTWSIFIFWHRHVFLNRIRTSTSDPVLCHPFVDFSQLLSILHPIQKFNGDQLV